MNKLLTFFCLISYFNYGTENLFLSSKSYDFEKKGIEKRYLTLEENVHYQQLIKTNEAHWKNSYITKIRSILPHSTLQLHDEDKLNKIEHLVDGHEKLTVYVMTLSRKEKLITLYGIKKYNKIAILQKVENKVQTLSSLPTVYYGLKKLFHQIDKAYSELNKN
jgi:hypothetical protein